MGVKFAKELYKNGKIAVIIVTMIIFIGVLLFSKNDAFLYHDTIAKITSIHTEKYDGGALAKTYQQNIKAVILNGDKNWQTIKLINLYSQSYTVDEKFVVGNQVFVSLPENKQAGRAKITGLKRDTYLALAIMIFLAVVLATTSKKGVYALFSLVLNIVLLFASLFFFEKNTHILLVSVCLMLLFCILSLLCATGFKKITMVAIIATLATVTIVSLLYFVLLNIFGDPEYFMMEYTEYLSNTNYFNLLFFTEVLIGGLGAIMDVAISVATTVDELVTVNPDIPMDDLYDGTKNVSYDIMGTMINVLFLSYFCGTIPLILIKLINNYGFTEIFKFHIPFELIRFLTGSIGIVLAIPISGTIAISLLKKKGGK